MALTQCPECKKDISSQAVTCPNCGYPLIGNQDKNVSTPSATPPLIQPQGQTPSPNPTAPINSKKKMSKAKLGCLVFLGIIVFFILLVVIGSFLPDSSEGGIPKKVEIISGQVVFSSWNDLNDFHNAAMQIADADFNTFQKAHPDGGTDADAKALTDQNQRHLESLRTKFEAENRILKIPVGTKIAITKFYDVKGNGIVPVWNQPQKKVYAPDGNSVYPSGEWEGKTVYILLMFDSNPPSPW